MLKYSSVNYRFLRRLEMENLDKKKGLINIIVSIGFKIILLIVSLLARRYLIKYIGNDFNGLNSLYISIIGFLSVADLGIETAITFSMYKPIVQNDNNKVAALYRLFKKLYKVICGVILLGGLLVMPFLKYLAKDYANLDVNLYLSFSLMLISVVMTYFYSAKTSLINAYKNNYVTTTIHSLGLILQYGLQILVLVITKSFTWYLVCNIIAVLFQWLITEIYARKKYGHIMILKQDVDEDTKEGVKKKVLAMFMHKIGAALVNSADSIIISSFIGLTMLGLYSNYTIIITAMMGVITLFFTPLTSVIGHLCVSSEKEKTKKYYNFFCTFNYIIGCIFFLGYFSIIDNVIYICFGEGLELARIISYVITLNYFIQFLRQSTLLFRDATGIFYYDRYKAIVEGVVNIILSISFVFLFGVTGVIVATIVTNLLICHTVEPYVLFVHGFESSPKKYYIRNYIQIALFTIILTILYFVHIDMDNVWLELVVNGFISVGFSLILCVLSYMTSSDFRYYTHESLDKLVIKISNKFK